MIGMIEIPANVKVEIEKSKIKISGPKGQVEREFSSSVSLKQNGNSIEINTNGKAIQNTIEAHLKNMFSGVQKEFTKKLKIVYAHFPINIEVKNREILIKNFLGEKNPRKALLKGLARIEVKGQEITLSSVDKEALGATFSSLKQATRIRFKDPRVFQDGFYPVD